ncbi:MAG: hypothetical protein AAFV33_16460 [Chloroflexota bacterium]
MAVELTWDDAGRTRLLMTFDTLWTWAEVRRAVRRGAVMLNDGGTHRVDVILDGSQTVTLMKSDTHTQTRQILARVREHPRVGRILVVGSSGITNSFLMVFLKLSANRFSESYTFFATVDNARQHLIDNPAAE